MKLNTKEFRALQAEWDLRLKESGFLDHEQRDGHLKTWSMRFTSGAEVNMEAKQAYFRAAGHFLHDYAFPDAVERRIWELHCQGLGKKPIVKTLREEGLWFNRKPRKGPQPRPCDFSVQLVLEKLRAEMLKRIENERQNNEE